MTGTNNNFTPEQWDRHVKANREAQRRVTPILAKQDENAPKGEKP